MRVAVLSDIHGNDVAFKAVVKDMEQYKVNYVVFLGDLVAKGPEPLACYQRMVALKPLVWLKGNTEYWLDNAMTEILPTSPENIKLLAYYDYMVKHMDGASMDHLIGLRPSKTMQMGHFEGICCHGSVRDVNEVIDPINNPEPLLGQIDGLDVSFVLSGHSHIQYDFLFKGIRMINPGAIGIPKPGCDGIAEYVVMEAGNSFSVNLRQVPYDVAELEAIMKEKNFVDKK